MRAPHHVARRFRRAGDPAKSSRTRTAVLATALAGGVVAARRRGADHGVDNPVPEHTPVLPPLPAGRPRTVLSEDGIDLHVVEHGASDASATVLLAHGYVQSSALWAGQVRDLVDQRPDLKVVTYDHRGHGRSGRTSRDRATLEQLAHDMAHVLDAVAPTGPVVVVGHSMGGMTIMALAEEHPELFDHRIAGVGFVGTSSGALGEVTYGLPVPVARAFNKALPHLHERAVKQEAKGKQRKVGKADAFMIFPRGTDPALVRSALDVHRDCSAETVAAFLPTFSAHDRATALAALAHVPVVVLAGDRDVLCPIEHSRAIAGAIRTSELVVFPGVGHMVHLERRPEVSRHLVQLTDRALAHAAATPAA